MISFRKRRQQSSESVSGKIGATLFGTSRSSPKPPKTYSLSKKAAKNKFGKKFQAGFFLIFFFAGAGVGYFFIFPAIIKSLNADDWIKTPCMVRSSRVQTHHGSDSTTYSVDIVYVYSFNGRQYRSGQYSFMGGSSSGYQGKAAVVRQYPAGKEAVCYVNPDNPAEAVLKKELGAGVFFAGIPILFMAIGLGGAVFSLRRGKTAGVVTNLAGKPMDAGDPRHRASGPLILKPKTSRAGKIIGSIVISLFWNGIVSVFVYQAFTGWQAGHPDYFLMVFMIPFVLIGLVMIGSIFYFIMAAFNPRPVIVLSKTTLRLGDSVPVNWATKGDVNKIQNFKLSLMGEESATYRRGTKTYTDRNTFYEKPIVTSHIPESIRRGEAMVQIPAESMHSFKSDNNAITWKIRMHCDVPRWPDAKDDFEITVYPLMLEDF